MSVKHRYLHQRLDPEVGYFPLTLSHALNNVQEQALLIGATIDWSTFEVTPGDEITIRDASGQNTQQYRDGLYLRVDAILLDESTIENDQ